MVEDHKKNESNDESEEKVVEHLEKDGAVIIFEDLWSAIQVLRRRVTQLERAMIEVKHINTDDGSRHRNDGGWFD